MTQVNDKLHELLVLKTEKVFFLRGSEYSESYQYEIGEHEILGIYYSGDLEPDIFFPWNLDESFRVELINEMTKTLEAYK